jgi:iron(III) transport system substrate-binding protein
MKINTKEVKIAVLILAMVIGFVGINPQTIQAEGQVEGKKVLHMCVSGDVAAMRIVLGAFEETHPNIELKWIRLSAGKALARIRAERENPQSSIWYVGPSLDHIAAKKDGLTTPNKESMAWQMMPEKFKDPDGYWAAICVGMIGFVSNKDFLEKHNVEAPKSWQDLLNPAFEGEIAMAYPYTSGTAYTVLSTIIQIMGEAKGFEYLEKLDKQMHHYTESGSACIAQAGMGEVGVGVAFAHDITVKGIWKGYPVEMTFPEEGTGCINAGAVSLIKGGPEPELAKIFYDWCLSAEAQSLYKNHDIGYIPVNPEAEVGEGVTRPGEVKCIKFDEVWSGENKERLVDIWRNTTGK